MLELRLLSRPRVILDGEVVTDFVSDKALALLCYLALNRGRQSRVALAGLLWGEKTGKRAKANLRVALHNLKKLLPGYLDVTRTRVAFNHSKPHWIDGAAFTAKVAAGDNPQALADVVALYEDDFLAGLHVNGASELEAWLRVERERLRLRLVDLLERLSDQYGDRHRGDEALAVMRRLLSVEPWREQTHRQLMLLLARRGRYAAALAQYEQCRALLSEELGVAPMPATEKLYERIRKLRSRPRHNLPSTPTPLVGREEELQTVHRRLKDSSCRLMTLYGPGGIGKTRLALALAERVRDHFLEGVFYVPLSDVDEPRHVPLAIAEAMGLSFSGPRPFAEQLLRQLDGCEVLLVLDNFEQLLAGTPFIQRLMESVPGARVLAVSRVILNLPGEWTFEVTGLALPDLDGHDGAAAGSVQLFLQNARQRQRDFAPGRPDMRAIGEICHLTEGIPLAIVQAASWLRVLTCRQLVSELRQGIFSLGHAVPSADRRQRSMEVVLDQSWRLLGAKERAAFQSLSVFRGGFTREAAAEVAGVSIQTLAALTNHSMIRFDDERCRYEVHELLRQFGAEKLAVKQSAEVVVRDRHAAYFVQFVTHWNSMTFSADEARALNQMQRDMENVRAAWRHTLAQRQPAVLETFLDGFWRFHELQGLYREGAEIFAAALEGLVGAEDAMAGSLTKAQGLARVYYGWFRMRTGAYESALEWMETGVAQLRTCRDELIPGWPVFALGFAVQLTGDYARAEALIRESAALHRAQGNESGAVHSESVLAFLWLFTGEVAEAQMQIERVMTEWADRGGRRMVSNLSFVKGLTALALGEPGSAEELVKEGLTISRQGGDIWNAALGTHYLGVVARAQANFAAARKRHQEALALMHTLQEKLGIVFCLLGLGWAEQGLENLQASREHFDEALEIAAQIHVRPQALEALTGIASCLLAEGKVEQAGELLSAVVTHPATAYPVRQQAKILLSKCSEAPVSSQSQGEPEALEPLVAALLSPEQPRSDTVSA